MQSVCLVFENNGHSSRSPKVQGNLDWLFESGKWRSAHRIGCWVAQLRCTVPWQGTGATSRKLELAWVAVPVRNVGLRYFSDAMAYSSFRDGVRDTTFVITGETKGLRAVS